MASEVEFCGGEMMVSRFGKCFMGPWTMGISF